MKLGPTVSDQVSDQVSAQVKQGNVEGRILEYCIVARTKKEIAKFMGFNNLTYMTRKYLKPLLEENKLLYTIPEKPRSRLQKYVTKK